MVRHNWISPDSFAEDRLPPGQRAIQTSSLKRFSACMALMTDPKRGYSNMGVVTGTAGIGKTVAVQSYLDSLAPRAHTGLPAGIAVKVKPRSTPKALALDIVAGLRDKPRGRNIYEVADEAAAAIVRNDLELLIIDEADRLNEDSFEVLRHLFDKTGCPLVVVGLPYIQQVIDRHEKFRSRVGLQMDFRPLERAEILSVVLPNLVIPHWEFDPGSATDLAMGERICEMVGVSLRKLRNLLQIASQMACYEDEPRIIARMIDEAFTWSATKADRRRFARRNAPEEKDQQRFSPTEFERESERRHAARKRGKQR